MSFHRWFRGIASAILVASLLAGCLQNGRSGPSETDPPAPTFLPSKALPSADPSPRPDEASNRSGSDLTVEGVSVDVCERCVSLTRRAGWNLPGRIRATLRRASPKLPGLSTHVRVLLARRGHPAAIGLTGRDSGEIRLLLDLRASAEKVHEQLPLLLAHELHHAQRITNGPGLGSTLVDDLVSEGLANAFALEVYPRYPEQRWIPDLDPGSVRVLWRRAQSENERRYSRSRLRRWFMDAGADSPHAGYALGHAIVQAYLSRHPEARPSHLASTSTEEILAGSGFAP